MSANLQQILIDSAAYLDLTAELPTDDELDTRKNYADRAVREGAASGHMKEFSKPYTTYATCATIPLPSDFREEETELYALNSSGGWDSFPIIQPKELYGQNIKDKFAYIVGNRAAGFTMTINNRGSYTTLSFTYQKYPVGLPSLSSLCELSDENYVTRKIESYVLESRSDDRFTLVDADANRKLANMAGRSNKKPSGAGNRTIRNFNNPLG